MTTVNEFFCDQDELLQKGVNMLEVKWNKCLQELRYLICLPVQFPDWERHKECD